MAGCTVTPPVATLPELSFKHLPPLLLDAATVDVRQAYKPLLRAPHVDHLLPLQPALAAERWARDRLRPAGSARRAVFSVLDASVTSTALPAQTGLRGLFTAEQTALYEARIVVVIEVQSLEGRQIAQAEAWVTRTRTLGEKLSVNERRRVEFELVEALMRDLNTEMESQLRRHLSAYMAAPVRRRPLSGARSSATASPAL